MMKKIVALITMIMMIAVLTACGSAGTSTNSDAKAKNGVQPQQTVQQADLQRTPNKGTHKTLVVYYSLTGNTKQIAEHIHDFMGGDMFEIKTVQTYPTEHGALIAQAKKELQEGTLPELQSKLADMAGYDTIFVGSPIWWGTDAPAIRTFLSQNDLSGKTVIPFVTHASTARSGGPGSGLPDIAAQAKGTKALDGMHFFEDKVSDTASVADWLKQIGMI